MEIAVCVCHICGKSLATNKILCDHVKRHFASFKCDRCDAEFSGKHNLLRHRNFACGKNPGHTCPLCGRNSPWKSLLKHFTSIHNVEVETEIKMFKCIKEFDVWREEFENKTLSRYIKRNCWLNGFSFHCHRSGRFRSKSEDKRQLKKQGSCKIGGTCPSRITATINPNDSVSVTVIKTHIGHNHDLNHIQLRAKERMFIAEKIKSNMPHNEIINNVSKNENFISKSVKKQDVRNINVTVKRIMFKEKIKSLMQKCTERMESIRDLEECDIFENLIGSFDSSVAALREEKRLELEKRKSKTASGNAVHINEDNVAFVTDGEPLVNEVIIDENSTEDMPCYVPIADLGNES